MRWIIDGYNVIRRDPDLRGEESRGLHAGRAALLRLVARAARQSGDPFTVVFDGAPVAAPAGVGGQGVAGQVEVRFSRPPQTADDIVMRLSEQWREGAVVVSSDRKLQDRARRAGCAVLGAEEFLAALSSSGEESGEDEEDDDEARAPKRGNPRRESREARAARRALRRLRPR